MSTFKIIRIHNSKEQETNFKFFIGFAKYGESNHIDSEYDGTYYIMIYPKDKSDQIFNSEEKNLKKIYEDSGDQNERNDREHKFKDNTNVRLKDLLPTLFKKSYYYYY